MTIEDQSIPPCDASNNNVAEFDAALHMLTGKWKGDILYRLVQHKHRFGELKRSIPGITQHMLTAQLRELEADGLVRRTVFAEAPPRVEYEVTDAALALRPVFDELFRWITQYGGGLRRARVSTVQDRESARPV